MNTEKKLKSSLEEEQEHDLAIWWEAYKAALSVSDLTDTYLDRLPYVADLALAAYKAKAAELAGK